MANKHTHIKRVKDPSFNIDELHNYTLSLIVGIRDFQLCITNHTNRVLLIEDFKFVGVSTVNERLEALKSIFENHHLLNAGFWKAIRLSIKTHKYTLVPAAHFIAESASDFLIVHCDIKPAIEEVYYHKHTVSDAVNVFAADKRLVAWLRSLYPNKDITVSHQGSALIEGILKYDDHSEEKGLYCFVDRGLLHVVVSANRKLLYYNQFAIKEAEDYLKYIMLVFKELGLNQKQTNVLMWGNLKPNSKNIALLKKYIRNISYGSRPSYLSFGFEFDEIPDHQYFDLLNVYLCE
ncbi:MAG: hypothetical protein ACI8QD_000640 [Cyclobacteriaceae bacterium]